MSTGEVNMTSDPLLFQGTCFCGAASFRVEGEPLISVYCHCTVCQRSNSCAVVHGLHYPASAFTWTYKDPDVIFTQLSRRSSWQVWRCKHCYTAIAGQNAKEDKWSVRSSHFKRNANGSIENWELIKPKAHIFYGTRMFDVGDDLPKWEGYEHKSVRMCVETDSLKEDP